MTLPSLCQDITPEFAPAAGQPDGARPICDLLAHQGWLYLAQLFPATQADTDDRLRLDVCELATGVWLPLLDLRLTPSSEQQEARATPGCRLAIVQAASPADAPADKTASPKTAPRLGVEVASVRGSWRFLAADASPRAPLRAADDSSWSGDIAVWRAPKLRFRQHQLAAVHKNATADHLHQLVAIGVDGTPVADGSANWLRPLGAEVASRVTHAASCHARLYLALRDDENGFRLLTLDQEASSPSLNPNDPSQDLVYRPLLERGAERYLHNAEVFALVAKDDALFLAAGTPAAKRQPESAYFDYPGFELLRVDADGTWQLLVGVPRLSADGLKLPLSALGPSLGARARGASRQREWRLLHAQAGYLLLGTSDDEDGFRLWSSRDGGDWQPARTDAFQLLDRVERCRALACGASSLVLEIDTLDFDDQERKHLFVLDLDQL
jgi:hypothetical protein